MREEERDVWEEMKEAEEMTYFKGAQRQSTSRVAKEIDRQRWCGGLMHSFDGSLVCALWCVTIIKQEI